MFSVRVFMPLYGFSCHFHACLQCFCRSILSVSPRLKEVVAFSCCMCKCDTETCHCSSKAYWTKQIMAVSRRNYPGKQAFNHQSNDLSGGPHVCVDVSVYYFPAETGGLQLQITMFDSCRLHAFVWNRAPLHLLVDVTISPFICDCHSIYIYIYICVCVVCVYTYVQYTERLRS